MPTEEISRILALVVGWGLAGMTLLIGVPGLIYAGWNFKQDQASLNWPDTTGRIISSVVDSNTSRSSSRPGGTRKSDADYDVRVHYAYDVEGQAQESRRLRFGSSDFKTRSEANKIHRRFSPEKEVAVYYDPEKPGRAVLLRGTVNHWGQLIGFGICLSVGLLILFFMVRITMRRPGESSV